MRFISEPVVKDDKKTIMFIDDLFESKEYPALKPVKELLNTEYYCTTVLKKRRPDNMVRSIRILCTGTLRPDLIVAYGTGATIAAQLKDIETVLIKPCYNTSNALKNMLGEKNFKTRIELPTLGKPEHLTIIRPMIPDYKHLEVKALQNGHDKDSHSIFFANDIETDAYKKHIEQFGNAVTVPGENMYDPAGIESVARFIRGVLEVE